MILGSTRILLRRMLIKTIVKLIVLSLELQLKEEQLEMTLWISLIVILLLIQSKVSKNPPNNLIINSQTSNQQNKNMESKKPYLLWQIISKISTSTVTLIALQSQTKFQIKAQVLQMKIPGVQENTNLSLLIKIITCQLLPKQWTISWLITSLLHLQWIKQLSMLQFLNQIHSNNLTKSKVSFQQIRSRIIKKTQQLTNKPKKDTS